MDFFGFYGSGMSYLERILKLFAVVSPPGIRVIKVHSESVVYNGCGWLKMWCFKRMIVGGRNWLLVFELGDLGELGWSKGEQRGRLLVTVVMLGFCSCDIFGCS